MSRLRRRGPDTVSALGRRPSAPRALGKLGTALPLVQGRSGKRKFVAGYGLIALFRSGRSRSACSLASTFPSNPFTPLSKTVQRRHYKPFSSTDQAHLAARSPDCRQRVVTPLPLDVHFSRAWAILHVAGMTRMAVVARAIWGIVMAFYPVLTGV